MMKINSLSQQITSYNMGLKTGKRLRKQTGLAATSPEWLTDLVNNQLNTVVVVSPHNGIVMF